MNIDYDIHGTPCGAPHQPFAVARASRGAPAQSPATGHAWHRSGYFDITLRRSDRTRARGYPIGGCGRRSAMPFRRVRILAGDRGCARSAFRSIRLDSPARFAARATLTCGGSSSITCVRRCICLFCRKARWPCIPRQSHIKGKGILLAGWAESGKTEAMLGFLQAGATFVSDKWTIVDGKGPSILHFPTPITVRHWMIDLIPGLSNRLKTTERLRAQAAGVAGSLLATTGAPGRVPGLREVKGLADLGGRVSVTPSQLFGNRHEERSRWGMSSSAPLECLFPPDDDG